MKKNNVLTMLVLSLMCTTGCFSNTSSTSSSNKNDKPSSSSSSTVIKDSSSTTSSTSSSNSSSVDAFDLEVQEKVGNLEKLKVHLGELSKTTKEISYTSNKYGINSVVNAKRKSHEIIIEENSDGDESLSYTGIVDNYYYELDSNEWSPRYSKTRIYADDEVDPNDYDKLSMSIALENLNYTISSQFDLTDSVLWGNLFRENTEGTEYKAKKVGNNIAVQVETYYLIKYGEEISSIYKYDLAALLDLSFNLKEGTFTQSTYRGSNFDKTTGRPIEGATPNSSESVSVLATVYGDVEETTTTPMLDFTPYSVTSLTGDANITSRLLDTSLWEYKFSEANIAWLGTDLFLNIEDSDTGTPYYRPTTALNANDLAITSSSDESLIGIGENDMGQQTWVVTSNEAAIGQTVALGVGFPGEEPISIIDVVIDKYVASEEPDTPGSDLFNEEPYIYPGQNCTYDSTTKEINITSLDSPVYILLESPGTMITDYEAYGYYMMNSSISPNYPINIEFSMQTANEQYDYEGLWLKITPVTSGSVTLVICDMPSMGEPTDLAKLVINVL